VENQLSDAVSGGEFATYNIKNHAGKSVTSPTADGKIFVYLKNNFSI
jgi:hypothetical protein